MMTIPKTLTVDGWNEHFAQTGESLHVYIDGEDVTRRCYRAEMDDDGIRGRVWLFLHNASGVPYLDQQTHEAAQETRYGVLEIKPGAPLR